MRRTSGDHFHHALGGQRPNRALLGAAALALTLGPASSVASRDDASPPDPDEPAGHATAATVGPDDEALRLEEQAAAPRLHRLGYGGGALLAAWDWGATDPLFAWDASGDTFGVLRLDYHYAATSGLALGGALEIDISDAAIYPGYAGVAVSAGLRVALWPDWLFVELETLAGYPWLVGGVASLGVAFPLDEGIWLRLDNRFLVALVDDAPFQAGWFPAFAVEMAL